MDINDTVNYQDYWEQYYATHNVPTTNSDFAQFVQKTFLSPNQTLIELGCGNGRDAIYFAQNDKVVTAVDQCKNISEILKNKNVKILVGDFTKLGNIGTFDNVYSRFTIHTISAKDEDDVMIWAYDSLAKGGFFFIEVRTIKNELYGKGSPVKNEPNAFIYENHYRRFIDFGMFKDKAKRQGFEIILADENKNFAPFEGTNYIFGRIILQKK